MDSLHGSGRVLVFIQIAPNKLIEMRFTDLLYFKKSSKVLEKTDRECRPYCDFGGSCMSRMHFVDFMFVILCTLFYVCMIT